MRISDWSSDVCSSDLLEAETREDRQAGAALDVQHEGLGKILDADRRAALVAFLAGIAHVTSYLQHRGDEKLGVGGVRIVQHLVGEPALDRKSTRLNSSHSCASRMPTSA